MTSNQDHSIEQALIDIETKRFRSIRQAAAYHKVAPSTLGHRRRGRKTRASIDSISQRLTNSEERVLVAWIEDLQKQHMSPNYHQITFVVEQMLRKKGDKRPLGTRWITRFRQRYPQLKAGRTQAMDIKRLLALDTDIVERFFEQISTLQAEFDVPNWEIYPLRARCRY